MNLPCLLSDISITDDAILCCNLSCNNLQHVSVISKFADSLSCACTATAAMAISHSAYSSQTRQIPGWSERIEPLREKSIFCHCLWIDCGIELV